MMIKKVRKYIIEGLEVFAGCIIMAYGISVFLLPNQLSSGGFSGIGTIIYYLFDIPLGTTILILNVPLMVFAFIKLGREFLAKSILGTILLSIFLDVFENLQPITDDRLLACIYGGIATGIGTALILKANSSTGGTDLISYLVRVYKPNFTTSNLIVFADIIEIGRAHV